MRVSPFDWRRLSRYAFWTALACVLISLGSLFADSELVAWLLEPVQPLGADADPAACAAGSRLLGWGFAASGGRRSGTTAPRRFVSGVVFTAVALAAANGWITAAAISHRCFWPDAYLLRHRLYCPLRLVWLFFLLALGNWFGAKPATRLGGGAPTGWA